MRTHTVSLETTHIASSPLAVEIDREALIVEHVSMVRMVARRLAKRLPQHIELDDLISAGMLGLLDAAAKFDWSKQVQFKSYAQFRIRGAIMDSLRTLDWGPRELRRQGRVMAEAIRTLSARLGRTPSDEEIATEMDMDLFCFQAMTGDLNSLEIGSLNEERSDDGLEEELDFLAAPETENPLTLFMETERRERSLEALHALPEKERLVLELYYGEELTLKEVGLALGVVESRVCQIRASAIRRLHKALGVRPGKRIR